MTFDRFNISINKFEKRKNLLVIIDFMSGSIPFDKEKYENQTIQVTEIFALFANHIKNIEMVKRDKGLHGYNESCFFRVAKTNVGIMAWGGNGGACYFQITGQGMALFQDLYLFTIIMEKMNAIVKRGDIALDLYNGEISIEKIRKWYNKNFFKSDRGGPNPVHSMVGDWDTHGFHGGRTLYIGRTGYKIQCIYEKGKQIGDKESKWLRVEAREYGDKRKIIPWDFFRNPERYFAGISHAHRVLLKVKQRSIGCTNVIYPERLKVIELTKDMYVAKLAFWCKRQYGAFIDWLTYYYTPEQIVENLRKNDVHTRLNFLDICEDARSPELVFL